jgi:hypothetical protein
MTHTVLSNLAITHWLAFVYGTLLSIPLWALVVGSILLVNIAILAVSREIASLLLSNETALALRARSRLRAQTPTSHRIRKEIQGHTQGTLWQCSI